MKAYFRPTFVLTVAVLHAAILSPSHAAAQPASRQATAGQSPRSKIPMVVSHTGQDDVGISLVAAIKEAIRRAPSASLVATADDAEVVLLVTTMNPDPAKPGTVTTASWTLLLMKEATRAYIGGGLRMCDPGSVPKAAAELMAHIEGMLMARSAEIPSSSEFEKAETAWAEAVEAAAEKLPLERCGVKVRDAFLEQMQVYFKWSRAASLTPDVQQAVAAGLSYFSVDDSLGKKIQAQSEQLSQCQAELAALKKAIKK
jgi:hypothetical protein